jgi:hypothetical protein
VVVEREPHRIRATLALAVGAYLHGVFAERQPIDHSGQRAGAGHEVEATALAAAIDPDLDLVQRHGVRDADVQARVTAGDLVRCGRDDTDVELTTRRRTGRGVVRRAGGLHSCKQRNEG